MKWKRHCSHVIIERVIANVSNLLANLMINARYITILCETWLRIKGKTNRFLLCSQTMVLDTALLQLNLTGSTSEHGITTLTYHDGSKSRRPAPVFIRTSFALSCLLQTRGRWLGFSLTDFHKKKTKTQLNTAIQNDTNLHAKREGRLKKQIDPETCVSKLWRDRSVF